MESKNRFHFESGSDTNNNKVVVYNKRRDDIC